MPSQFYYCVIKSVESVDGQDRASEIAVDTIDLFSKRAGDERNIRMSSPLYVLCVRQLRERGIIGPSQDIWRPCDIKQMDIFPQTNGNKMKYLEIKTNRLGQSCNLRGIYILNISSLSSLWQIFLKSQIFRYTSFYG